MGITILSCALAWLDLTRLRFGSLHGELEEVIRGRRVEGECREWGLRHLDRAPTHFTRPLLPYLALRTTNATVLSFIFTFHSSAQLRLDIAASHRIASHCPTFVWSLSLRYKRWRIGLSFILLNYSIDNKFAHSAVSCLLSFSASSSTITSDVTSHRIVSYHVALLHAISSLVSLREIGQL